MMKHGRQGGRSNRSAWLSIAATIAGLVASGCGGRPASGTLAEESLELTKKRLDTMTEYKKKGAYSRNIGKAGIVK